MTMDDEDGRLKDEVVEELRKRRNDDSELVPHEEVEKQVRDDSCEKSEKRLISMKKCLHISDYETICTEGHLYCFVCHTHCPACVRDRIQPVGEVGLGYSVDVTQKGG